MHFYEFPQSSSVIDPLILLVSIINSCWAFSAAFFVCELSERMSDSFVRVGDMVDQFDWYRFTDDMQRMLLIIFMQVHDPIDIKCFGNITCSRETYKNVRISD